jgi:hypothetical protein
MRGSVAEATGTHSGGRSAVGAMPCLITVT